MCLVIGKVVLFTDDIISKNVFDKIVLLDINTMHVYECFADVGYDALGSTTRVTGIHNGLPIMLMEGTKNGSAKPTFWQNFNSRINRLSVLHEEKTWIIQAIC